MKLSSLLIKALYKDSSKISKYILSNYKSRIILTTNYSDFGEMVKLAREKGYQKEIKNLIGDLHWFGE